VEGWSLLVYLLCLAAVVGELVWDGLFVARGFIFEFDLVESLLGWLHLEVVMLVGWSLLVHLLLLAELLQEDLFEIDCLLLEGLFSSLFLDESLLGWLHLEVVLFVGHSLLYLAQLCSWAICCGSRGVLKPSCGRLPCGGSCCVMATLYHTPSHFLVQWFIWSASQSQNSCSWLLVQLHLGHYDSCIGHHVSEPHGALPSMRQHYGPQEDGAAEERWCPPSSFFACSAGTGGYYVGDLVRSSVASQFSFGEIIESTLY
jgi:hypothetical protein